MVEYAKNQPAGFQNYLKNIAVVGAGGKMGSEVVNTLLRDGRHTITALTRAESTSVVPPGVITKHIDYSSHDSMVAAMKGQDALIITMSNYAPPDQEAALIKAAGEAGIKWVMPNEWGNDFANPDIARDALFLGPRLDAHRKLIEDFGGNWLVITTGFWYEYSLAGTEWRYGFDFKKRTVTFYSGGTQKINTTTWPQVSRAVGALFSMKILPDDENDKTQALLSRFKNQRCYISSFLVSQRDMLESAMRVTGTTEKDWTITHEDAEERYKRGVELFQKGDRAGYGIALYARGFYSDGEYETTRGLDNALLGLPKEDLDAATERAVERSDKLAGTY